MIRRKDQVGSISLAFIAKRWKKDFQDQALEMVNAYESQEHMLKEKEIHMEELQIEILAMADQQIKQDRILCKLQIAYKAKSNKATS